MKTMEGLATSSTAMVSRFLCSTDRPEEPALPTTALARDLSSTKSMTYAQQQQAGCVLAPSNFSLLLCVAWFFWADKSFLRIKTA